ncbi:hypothetical protein FOL75_04875 [Bacillus thuringiensis]|nr:hypothetical protein [Bacillus thuringiensis]
MPKAKFVVVESKKENQQHVELPKEENEQEVGSNGITKGEIKFVEKNGVIVPMKNAEDDVALSVNTTLKDIANNKDNKNSLNTPNEPVNTDEDKKNEENKQEEVKQEENKQEEVKSEDKKEDKKGKDKDKSSNSKDKTSETKEGQGSLSPITIVAGVAGVGAVGVGAGAAASPTFRRSLQNGLRRLRDLFRK